mgnify:CR=1 FL=1
MTRTPNSIAIVGMVLVALSGQPGRAQRRLSPAPLAPALEPEHPAPVVVPLSAGDPQRAGVGQRLDQLLAPIAIVFDYQNAHVFLEGP